MLRFEGGGHELDDLRQAQHLAHQRQFVRGREQGHVAAVRGAPRGGGAFEHGGEAGVRVLDVVDGVFVRLFQGKVEVELHLRGGGAQQEEEAGGVGPHLLDELVERDDVARALGDAHGAFAPPQRDQLVEEHVQPLAAPGDGLRGHFHAGDVAVVVRAPDVDDEVEAAALEFVVVVGDVAGEVGGAPVGAHDDVVLVLAEVGGGEPEGALALGQPSALAQARQRGVPGGGAPVGRRRVERAFAEPAVIAHAERFQRGADAGDHEGDAELAQGEGAGFARAGEEAVALALAHLFGQFGHVLAAVAAVGDGGLAPEEAQVAGVQRLREEGRLRARVVHVVLALDRVAGGGERGGERVADGGAAPIAHVQRSRGVGGDELDLRAPSRADGDVGEGRAALDDAVHLGLQEAVGEAQVDEAGGGGAGLLHEAVGGQARGHGLGDGEGRHHGGAGEAQGQRAGVVAVRRVAGAFEGDVGQGDVGQGALGDGRAGGLLDERGHAIARHGVGHALSLARAGAWGEWAAGVTGAPRD